MINKNNQRSAFTITFNTTEDCNLACRYCYETNKHRKTMDIETAKKFIDIILADDDPCNLNNLKDNRISWLYDSITLDFIGGDSLMQPLLLDKILSYWASRLYTAHSENAEKWKKNWRASISSNGTLFANPEVRAFIDDWLPVLSIGVSIDGCPDIHDENRIFVDGRPSMPVIMQWWDWYRERFPNDSRTTKATCSRNSIPYLFDSLRFMHEEMGLNWINQNFIMEDTSSTAQDYQLLRQQMDKCIDYVFDHRTDLYWSMIDRDNFALAHRSEGDDWEKKGHCGSGTMPALGIDGKIYPCFRFLPHTQEVASPVICGDVEKGLYNKQAFTTVCESSYRANCTTKEECKSCDCESGCTYCIAGCYSEFGEFKRQTYICEFTKIQSEYARKYWNRWEKANGTDFR